MATINLSEREEYDNELLLLPLPILAQVHCTFVSPVIASFQVLVQPFSSATALIHQRKTNRFGIFEGLTPEPFLCNQE